MLELSRAPVQRVLMPRLGTPFEPAHIELAGPWWRQVFLEAPEPVLAPTCGA